MELIEWAKKYNISGEALDDLLNVFFKHEKINVPAQPALSEQDISNLIRLEAAEKGIKLWRNNVGALRTEKGFIRFGLANDSTRLNENLKSADLIGIRKVKITPDLVGYTLGQFISREIKKPGWKFTGDQREIAQLAWAQLICSYGGDAAIVTGVGSL